jgi:hypothetical protein
MTLAGWSIAMLGLVACGDNGSQKLDAAAALDAHAIDAPADAFAGACVASDQCAEVANPTCCLAVSPGGAATTICGTTASSTCTYVHCRGASDACLTKTGASGTCTFTNVGSLTVNNQWVCH